MDNIKQKLLKFIISFSLATTLAGCTQTAQPKLEKAVTSQENVNVAIILPLSGEKSILGREYAQMIKLGLSHGTKSKIHVTTYDSTDPEALDKSLDKILDDGVDIIIGPIYSEETKSVSAKIKDKGIIALSLSNNPILADKQTFVFGHAPMRQLEQITNYFLGNKHQNYIALLPEGRYSHTVSKILKSIITSKGAHLAHVEFYGSTQEEMEKSLHVVSEAVDNLNENNHELPQPVILLADDPHMLSILLNRAHKINLDKKAILVSDSRIDVDEPAEVTTTFTGGLNTINFDLNKKAKQLGIAHCSFMHILAYDAGRIVGTYIGENYNKTKFIGNLNSQDPFHGASGTIGFIDSIAGRKYDIIKKENGQYIPASDGF